MHSIFNEVESTIFDLLLKRSMRHRKSYFPLVKTIKKDIHVHHASRLVKNAMIFPWKGIWPFFWIPSPKNGMCQVPLNRAFKLEFPSIFLFSIITLWEKAWPYICANLNSIHSRTLCATLGWNWPISVRWCECIFAIFDHPLEKSVPLNPLYLRMFFVMLNWNWQFLKRNWKCEFHIQNRQIGRQMDDEQEKVRKVYFSFQVR